MSAVFELDTSTELFNRERDRYLASVDGLDDTVPGPNRVAERYAAVPAPTLGAFENTPDTDPAVTANREWVDAILARVPATTLGADAIAAARVPDAERLDALIASTNDAAAAWAARPAAERAAILHAAGEELERRRGDLLEIMAAEGGKTVDQGDPEVSEAIDFAHYYADQALAVEQVDGARFTPAGVIAVIPPWNFPVAIPAGGVLAALAAGNAVVFKPAKLTQRCGAVVAEALWTAGVPRDVLTLVDLADHGLGQRLVSDERIARVILTGSIETAELFRGFRPDLRLLGETSGKNAIIVTPSADLDLAVKDVVSSAFGHAGQKCSAASLVVLVGSVARSPRFRRQLIDAVRSFTVGRPTDVTSRMGPIVEPAKGKLLRGLTTLGEGERWLVEPRKLDETGTLWSPGVREGVQRGSEYHLVEYFGPILGIMTADTLAEAIDIVNDVDYGLTSGLHSLNPAEVSQWVDGIHAGNLYINRGITGAIVRRQPFGGWKKSAVGAGTKAGGPSYEFALGSWSPAEATELGTIGTEPRRVLAAARRALEPEGVVRLERALGSDAHALATAFAPSDVSGLECERNVLRHLPVTEPVQLRLGPDGDAADLLRVVAAALAAKAPFAVSSAVELPAGVDAALPVPCKVTSDEAWYTEVEARHATRVRLIGGDASALARACRGRVDLAVWADPVTEAGRVELLPFLHEQAVSMTAHRFGSPTPLVDVLA
jgi:RHH-type proline utilization regulon transcriptional repressor/proline dehydrogenase/delta 1-pyrroline-5-carboxylate dehydrogenase